MQLIVNSENNQVVASFVNATSETEKLTSANKLKNIMNSTLAFDGDVCSVFVASLKDDSYVGVGVDAPDMAAHFMKSAAFDESIKDKDQINWVIFQNGKLDEQHNLVFMVRVIKNLSSGEELGVLGVAFYGSKINRLINASLYDDKSAATFQDRPYTMIVNRAGKVYVSPDDENFGLDITKLLSQKEKIQRILKQNHDQSGMFFARMNNQDVLVTYKQLIDQKWYLLGISSNSYLYKETNAVGWITFLLAVIISIIAMIISLLVSLSISIPLDQIKDVMKKAENGNLTIKVAVNTQDELAELGNSFNRMLEKIGQLIIETKTAIDEILNRSTSLEDSSEQSAKTAESIAVAMDQITKGTFEQTQETEKSSQQMTDLSSQIENVVAEAGEVERITGHAKELSFRSKEAVDQLIQKTNDTDKITGDIINDISELRASAEEIRGITEVISNISEQTNLLALNAAIEAARAGEMGLGFAVVAEEVNILAVQSRDAAKTINNILKKIQAKTAISAQTAGTAYLILVDQRAAVQLTREAFDQIISSMSEVVARIIKVNDMINNINNLKNLTVRSITNISSISQETAASAEEVFAASEEQTASAEQLKMLAVELRRMAEQLVIDVAKFQINE
jgi:methyl-accepting chemotaxis protein